MKQLIVCNGVEWSNDIRRTGGYVIIPRPVINRTDQSANTGRLMTDYRGLVMQDIRISYPMLELADYLSIYNSVKGIVDLEVTYWDYNEDIWRTGLFRAPNFIQAEPMAAPTIEKLENVQIILEAVAPVVIDDVC